MALVHGNFGSDLFREFYDTLQLFDNVRPQHHYQTRPLMNVHEDEHSINYELEMPGLEKNDILIHEDHGIVTVEGEKRLTYEDKKEGYRRVESSYGKFCRKFSLPNSADSKNLNAKFNNGVLAISVPKYTTELEKKQIQIE